jgi:hypothetical protein
MTKENESIVDQLGTAALGVFVAFVVALVFVIGICRKGCEYVKDLSYTSTEFMIPSWDPYYGDEGAAYLDGLTVYLKDSVTGVESAQWGFPDRRIKVWFESEQTMSREKMQAILVVKMAEDMSSLSNDDDWLEMLLWDELKGDSQFDNSEWLRILGNQEGWSDHRHFRDYREKKASGEYND